MAEIAPFRGMIYNNTKLNDLRSLVAPPYDVVTPEEQAAYHASNPYNILHLTLGASRPEDQHPYDWHKRSTESFRQWVAEEILVRQDEPAVYLAETDFSDPNSGKRLTRHGFICLLRLEDFDKDASVRPHERTFSSTKAERLDLLLQVNTHLSQIFAVFPDEEQTTQTLLEPHGAKPPLFDFMDAEGRGHRIWPVTDPGTLKKLCRFMQGQKVYIADGHHRYETSLNYRRHMLAGGMKIAPDSPLNYTMVYLCPISDPGLFILPAHRLVSNSVKMGIEELEAGLGAFFDIQAFSFNRVEEHAARQAFLRQLERKGRTANAIGVYSGLAKAYYLLVLKKGAGKNTALDSWPEPLRKLDTVVLTGLILQQVLGLTEEKLDDPARITYTSRAANAIRQVNEGQVEMACILNPTPIEQVAIVAESGLTMPRKSTYFYPKVITGLILNPIHPEETIDGMLGDAPTRQR